MLLNKGNEAVSMCICLVLEVEALVELDNVDGFVVGVVSKSQLLEEEHGALVRYSLPYLDT